MQKILFFELTIMCYALLSITENRNENLTKCIELKEEYVEHSIHSVSVVSPIQNISENLQYIVQDLAKNKRKLVSIFSINRIKNMNSFQSTDAVVIEIPNLNYFKNSLKRLQEANILHTHFHLIMPTCFNNSTLVAKKILKKFIKYSLFNVIFLMRNSDNETYSIYKLSPNKEILIGECNKGNYMFNTTWPIHEILKNFKFSQITAVYLNIPPYAFDVKTNTIITNEESKWYGIEVTILINIMALLNITVKFVDGHALGEVFANGSITGSLKLLAQGNAHIAFGGYSQNTYRCMRFHCTFPHYFETLNWAVPQEYLSRMQLENIAMIIRPMVWPFIIFYMTISTLLIVLIAKNKKLERKKYKKGKDTFTEIILITTTNYIVPSMPRSCGVRIIYFFIFYFALIYSSIFTTYITSILSSNQLIEKYSNMDDIVYYNLEVYISPNSERFFRNNESKSYFLMQNAKICEVDDYKKCLTKMVMHKNVSFLGQKGLLDFMKSAFVSKSENILIRVLPPVLSYPINFIMIKEFWGIARVNDLLLRTSASGLIQKWKKLPRKSRLKECQVKFQDISDVSRFEGMEMIFLIIIIVGFSIACLVFIMEVLWFKWEHSNIRIMKKYKREFKI
ncbi:hypothetical protein ABEB36_008915 [Hypothenemus hampei]|uniref:Uncharacterized protein n=1 Tax=Hypothenemus hampei TaxID=57062 RepID=A0ABD1ENH7_HYPHA